MARAKLDYGENSIDRVKAKRDDKGTYYIRWAIRLTDGKLRYHRSQGPTAGEARRRAKEKAEDLLQTSGGGAWTLSTPVEEYLDEVSAQAIEGNKNLKEISKVRYRASLRQLRSQFKGHTLNDLSRVRMLKNALMNIAEKHGTQSGRHARTVLSKYVFGQMSEDFRAFVNPIRGLEIPLGNFKKNASPAGGRALADQEYDRVIKWLISYDASQQVDPPKRGPYSYKDRIAVFERAVDLTLLQAGTGLRIGEARTLTWENVEISEDGTVQVTVTPELSKTGKGRTVPILEPVVADHIRTSRPSSGKGFVIGAPSDPLKMWEQDNAHKAVRRLLRQAAECCDVPLLNEVGSHVWRTTLNTLYIDTVPEVLRAQYFGHTIEVNRDSYTDGGNTAPLLKAARARRKSTR